MDIQGIDSIDNRILELLKDNARAGYTEIGSAVGLSRVSVRNRVESLEKKGIIKGYQTLIDPEATPGGTKFFLDIETEPDCYEHLAEILSKDRRIRQIYSMTGSCRLHVVGFASTSADAGYFARSLYKHAKGIKKFEWNIVAATLFDVDGGVEYVVREDHGDEHLERGQQSAEGSDQKSEEGDHLPE